MVDERGGIIMLRTNTIYVSLIDTYMNCSLFLHDMNNI